MTRPPRAFVLWLSVLLLSNAVPVGAATLTGGWGLAQPIETDSTGNAGDPQVAFDAAGDGQAVWWQFDGARNSIFSSRFNLSGGWGVPALLESDSAGNAAAPQVAINSAGDAFAVWHQDDGTRDSIFANQYVAGSGWGNATLLETDQAGNARNPQVALGPNGSAIAVWYQTVATRDSIFANRYDPASGWANATLLETDNTGNARNPQVTIAPNGTAFAVWYQTVGADNIYANRYEPASGWGNATLLETDNSGNARNPDIAIAPDGAAFAVWYQTVGADNIYANRYDAASGWSNATLLETAGGNARNPQIATGANGSAVAIWYQNDGTRDSIFANRFTAPAGWGSPSLLETDNAGNARDPQVATDAGGVSLATWFQSDGKRNNIWAARSAAGGGWGVAALLETDNSGNAVDARLALDALGDAAVVWSQSDGFRNNIWASRYSAPDVTPPPLSITSPTAGTSTEQPSIWVVGSTEPGATLSVNGVLASVASNGSFALMVALSPGVNRITATAADASGNAATLTLSVTADDPLALVRQQLDDAQAALTASQANLSDAQAKLASAEANLSAANADAQALQAALASAQTSLAGAVADLASARANLSLIEAAIAPIQLDLADARGDVNASAAHLAALEADQNASQADIDAARAQLAADQARVAQLEGNLSSAEARAAAARANVTALQAIADIQSARVDALNASLEQRKKENGAAQAQAAQASSVALAGVVVALLALGVAALALLVGRRRSRGSDSREQAASGSTTTEAKK